MRKKICLVGGEDVHKRIPLSKYLIEFGFDVTILGTGTQPFPKEINYIGYNLKRHFSPTSDYKTLLWYKHFFNKNKFDIIHTFDTKPCFLVPLALLKTETPITRTITGLGTIFMSKSFFSFILRNVYTLLHFLVRRRIAMTTFQNEDDRDIYLSRKLITAKNHKMIFGSGIELKHITQKAQRNNKQFTFICVARLVYEKGIVNLLEAARICSNRGHTFKYLLVGPLEEHSKYLNKDILKAYEDIVDILGIRHDVFDLLLASDAFVLPTFREGFARVLMEAASVGLPIVSTNVPGVREFARHNIEALIVESKDSKALADAMIMLATNKPLADKLAKNALHRVELFNLENISKQYISIFNEANNHN
jgi:glycosyltransferase involved in cell wall biosynthesis